MSPAKKKTTGGKRQRPFKRSGKPGGGGKGPGKKRSAAPNKKKQKAATQRKKSALKRLAPQAAPVLEENPAALALARKIAQLTVDKKAEDVSILDVRGKTSYADYLVLASGESERQVAAMAEHVEVELKKDGRMPVGSEGYETGHWVLIDYGEVVAHLFYREVRSFYDLDGLWADAQRERVLAAS